MNDEELLDHLVREARDQRPTLDMAALEARVLDRVSRDEAPRFSLPQPRSRRAPLFIAVGVAAAAAAALFWGPFARTPAPQAGRAVATAPAPVVAEALDAGVSGRSLERPGFASLWLAPDTRGSLREEPEKLSFELIEGSVSLDVRPQPAPDRVEVLAGSLRVSVKGTRFRVTRHGEHVEVDVEHGAVQITPLGPPHSFSPVLLRGPAAGTFAPGQAPVLRDPVPFSVTPSLSAPSPTAALAPPSAPASAPSPVALSHSPRVAPPNTATEQELRNRSLDLASSCLTSSSTVAPGVSVTIETTLAIEADAAGKISSFSFTPPLAPAVEQCFQKSKAQLRGPSGRHSIPLSLSLGTK